MNNQNSLEPSLELYLERADDLVVKVVELGSELLDGGEQEPFAEDVKDLMEKCSAYRVARRAADESRNLNILSTVEAQTERETRLAFVVACKALDDKWMELTLTPLACACDATGSKCQHAPGQCGNASAAFRSHEKSGEAMQRVESGMCQECWDCGGGFRAPAQKKAAQRGAVA